MAIVLPARKACAVAREAAGRDRVPFSAAMACHHAVQVNSGLTAP
jgi:hypothetical protein